MAFLTLLCCLQPGCLRQLHSGLFLYQGFLQALAGISPKLAPTLDVLHLDIADLATNIWQQVSLVRTAVLGAYTELVPRGRAAASLGVLEVL